MGTWEEIRTGVKVVAKKTAQKTGEVAENASMHLKLARLISKCDEQFEKLGKLTYRQLKSDGVSYAEAIAAVIARIDALTLQIAQQKAKIEKAKAKREAERAEASAARGLRRMTEEELEEERKYVANIQDLLDENIKD